MPPLRKQLERQIGPIDDRDWRMVVDEGKDWDVAEGLRHPDEVVEYIRRLRDLRRPLPRADGDLATRTTNLHARSAARAALATLQLNEDRAVRGFRARELNGELLAPRSVEDWLVETFENQRPAYWPYGHPVTGERVSAPRSLTNDEDWPGKVTLKVYVLQGKRYRACNFAVPVRGRLARLAAVSERAAQRWSLEPGDVAESILTGREVEAPAATISAVYRMPFPASTITLRVDPYATPAQVAAIWADVRSQVFRTTPRRQSDKHLELAAHRLRNPELGGPELRRRWNAEHPEKGQRYDTHRHFMRDVKLAVARFAQPAQIPGM